ncbi:DUF1353 domain-containing protein [Aquitalea aquatica]|uniref:DUF1353 domain-containing protein n=1 Tax=Aquitalea aquatica TaxID=3044273 RepID=A0A838Y5W5_9NEIS|nr:DUF1353 domain-containing protein [Aquitalea magnusonii]MBA4708752.1 DUF1353 domain-containing protein [Aquitalea magnusonii]
MSAFLSDLATVLVDDTAASGRGIWKVLEPLRYQSDILGKTITVEPGFLTDYASVPRVPLLYLLFGDTTHKAAVLHDWLYHHHEVCDEDTANLVLLEAAKVARIPAWRRLGIYLGVKIGGESSWEEDGRGDGHQLADGVIV